MRCVLQRGNSVDDGCELVSTLCKYDLRNGVLFVLNWARMRRVRWEVCTVFLLPLVARCLETIEICIWCIFVFILCCVAVVRLSV